MNRTLLLLPCLALLGCEPAPIDEGTPYEPAVAVPPCTGNNDGVIERAELPYVVGVRARYRINDLPSEVSTQPQKEFGVDTWDFTRPDAEASPQATFELSTLDGFWFAPVFEGADYAAALDPGPTTYGAVVTDDDGVYLHGFASAQQQGESGQTLASYDQPIALYQFPLALGDHFTSTARAEDARLLGLPSAFDDTYDIEVTGRGTLKLPDLVLENTLRITVRFERTLLAGDTHQVSHLFVHECLGEVARLISPAVPLSTPLDDEFTDIQQLWRLAL